MVSAVTTHNRFKRLKSMESTAHMPVPADVDPYKMALDPATQG